MKILIKAVMAISFLVLGLVLTEKMFHPQAIGLGSILAFSLLLCSSLLSVISLLAYRSHKNIVEKSWLAFLSASWTYLLADLAAGFLLISPASPRILPDPYVHHRFKPNSLFERKTTEFQYVQRINNLGLRGPDVNVVKNGDTFRILMLGDSFTVGKGVKDDETFSVLLGESLTARKIAFKGKSSVEVLNAGVDSYSPILSFFQLTKQLNELDPDLVVFNFDMSDLIQEVAYRRNGNYGAEGNIVGVNGVARVAKRGPVARVRYWINQNLYLTRLILIEIGRLETPTEITIEDTVTLSNRELLRHTLADDSVDRAAQWQNIFDSITRIKTYCDEHQSDFLLTLYPWGHQVNENEWVPGRKEFIPDHATVSDKSIEILQAFARGHSMEVLNVFPRFRSYKGTAPLYFKHDMHWTAEGHRLMAEELGEYLVQRYSPVSKRD